MSISVMRVRGEKNGKRRVKGVLQDALREVLQIHGRLITITMEEKGEERRALVLYSKVTDECKANGIPPFSLMVRLFD